MKPVPLFAWVTMVGDKPSVIGTYVPAMQSHMALVSFSRENMERFRPLAESHGKGMGQPVYFVQFDTMKVLTGKDN